MALFLSEEEFRGCAGNAKLVAEKADAFIRELYAQIETVKAEADAASITFEQTSSLIEQKYVSLSAEYSSLQSQFDELKSSSGKGASELEQLRSEKQQLLVQTIEKDGEIERLTTEASELHKSKRQLMELLEQKDLEIGEKNATTKSYLDKIINLSEAVASKEARLGELESELGRMQATSARALQEKELLERHNKWLNDELTTKVDSLVQLRKANGELEVEMSSKLADADKKFQEISSSLKWHKDRVKDMEDKLCSTEKELLATKDAAAAAEGRFSAEISTVNKLVDLYKESSEEWSKKAGELEGVIKALETHLNQVESEYKEKLEKEVSARKDMEKEFANLKEKLQTSEAELKKLRKENEQKHLSLSCFTSNLPLPSADTNKIEDDRAIVPHIPAGVSGTALAASLLRDGWPLAKMYAKYQEAVDALHHEQLGRKQTQAVLERVLYEIEEKAGAIMDEREEHDRLVEAYSTLNQKLQHSLSEHSVLETTINELKANIKKQEREYAVAQKEITDLQKQVAVLLKECRDIQLRCGSAPHDDDGLISGTIISLNAESNADDIISTRLLTFKDINGLVEQNVQLRSLVRNLSDQIAYKEAELKEKYEDELKKHTSDTASKVNQVLKRAEEQAQMIESLHTSVAMYKRLYEEEHKLRALPSHLEEAVPVQEQGSRGAMLLLESSSNATQKVQEHTFERLKSLEEDVAKSRGEIISMRAERDKYALEAQFAQEKLDRFMKEFEHQRQEHNGVLARNVEFSQLIVDYQRKLRESAEAVDASNELSRKLKMEVSMLQHEKEILQNSEKRASDEVQSLSERVHRLQASLDTIHSTEEVREEARGIEKRKQEEYISKIEREWADAKRELQEERDTVRNLTLDRESTLKNALRQVEELSKDLANAMQSVTAAESRAAVAEARCSDLEKIIESATTKDSDGKEGAASSASSDKLLANYREEIEKLRREVQSSSEHMLQYKSIAQVNEEALKQIEVAYQNFKNETDEAKRSLEAELHSLKERICELESECQQKTAEAISANAGKDEALMGALSEISNLKDDCANKKSEIVVLESRISALKEDLEREHQRWRNAQDNYERQVILQSDTIQELTKTSQALAAAQEEVAKLRKVADTLKSENNELKSRWEMEKLAIEAYKNDADRKYDEINELNKILHSRLEALHIQAAEKERGTASSSQNLADDDGLQSIVSYLRRSKEIAETEISLLKQEKIRLQSQLEIALKSSEEAQATLRMERAKSRSSVFSEEEFKSLQLQVREVTLLRESNVQLREENRHNFEECQKLREAFQSAKIQNDNMENLLRDKDTELEAYRKEIDMLKLEKAQLENRIDELVQKCKDVDVDDYNRMKESLQQMDASLKEKDAQLEEIKKHLSEKQDAISLLEKDLDRTRTELSKKETRINDILQADASLKSEVEKLKRMNIASRRKYDNLLKEKDDLNKEVQSLSKQLEEAKQAKQNTVDSAAEQALKEKEKEKDTRIQILEKTLERHREDLKKEKEDLHKEKEKNQKMRKTLIDSRTIVTQEKTMLSDELSKHKQALKELQDEVEKLKSSGQPESTSVIQHSSVALLEDFASTYYQAVENFEQVSQSACVDPDSAALDAPPDNTSSAGQIVSLANQTPPVPAATAPLARTSDDKNRRLATAKASAKIGRRLVRPSITRPKEPQGEVDMSEADESNTGLSSQNAESQGHTATVPAPAASIRKRPSTSLSSEMQEDLPAPEETSPDSAAPLHKKPKGSESLQEGGEEPGTAPGKLSEVLAVEEPSDAALSKDETVDVEREDFDATVEQGEDPATDEQMQVELPSETVETAEEKLDKPSETVMSDDQLRDQTEQDIQQIISESSGDREEGEMVAEYGDNDDNNVANEMSGLGSDELQAAPQTGEPENTQITDPMSQANLESGEIDPSQTPPWEEDKIVDTTENIPDNASKLKEASPAPPDPATDIPATGSTVTATEEASTSSAVDAGSSEQGGSTPPQDTGTAKPVSPVSGSSTTINLQERARQRAHLRQAGMASSTSTTPGRARGRTIRGRGARGTTRGGRGQSSGIEDGITESIGQ
ncbi:nuclear-pore anchor isoform X2 [Andrographis paniculata]|uniref:nuclear-pore anchor isoform X2 n=2 Tax=Andrographis paniculata TaxID=175694 RepID=UPI0021E93EC5|nr:nuclear-pore anchor isoform X2 [Andrographis paniculata]